MIPAVTVDAAEPGLQSMSIRNDTGQRPTFLEGPLEMADGASLVMSTGNGRNKQPTQTLSRGRVTMWDQSLYVQVFGIIHIY